ncbi:MAG: small basic protein [Planctomycetota bacterium]
MTIHKSLAVQGRLARSRNVLSRWERIVRMQQEERWEEGRPVFGLPKYGTRIKIKKKAKKKEEAAADATKKK